jgi:nucleotide-binding universal stress UspA family protein
MACWSGESLSVVASRMTRFTVAGGGMMHFRKVVIAVDFSAASLAAARWVAMQLAPRAELALVHVVSAPAAPSFVRPHLPSLDEVMAGLTPALLGALRGLAGVVGSERTTVELLTGTPADVLAAFARDFDADLICLGRRRRRRGAARFGDTTAQRLLAQTRIPVLVVPSARPTPPARILAAVDDAPGVSTDLHVAWRAAHSYEAALEVLHVLAPELPRLVSLGLSGSGEAASTDSSSTSSPNGAHAAGSFPDIGGEYDADGGRREPIELYLDGKARLELLTHEWLASQVRLASVSPRRITTHVRLGDPGEQIIRFVHATGADLVFVGRGHDERSSSAIGEVKGSADAFPLGSTSRLVLMASPCPVLVLPPAARATSPEPLPRSGLRRFQVGVTNARHPTTTAPRRGTPRPDGYPPAARVACSPRWGDPDHAG